MLSSNRILISGEEATTVLPDELLVEILSRLPGKHVGRCRCVCKAWRAIIGSRLFRKAYRELQRGLLFCSLSIINRDDGTATRRLQFFHCPFRRPEEPQEEFSPLLKLDQEVDRRWFGGRSMYLTHLVDGLVCVGDCNLRLTLHNVCTGETMNIPDPNAQTWSERTYSRLQLGYDRESREYKLLKLIFSFSPPSIREAHILTLRPPSSSLQSTWKVLDNDAAGIRGLQFPGEGVPVEAIKGCDDGVLSWIYISRVLDGSGRTPHKGLLTYNFSRERFQYIELPVPDDGISRMYLALTRFNGSLALWLHGTGVENSCYVLEGERRNWSRQTVKVSKHFDRFSKHRVVSSGKLPGSSPSNSNMLMMSPYPVGEDERRCIYSYCSHPGKDDDAFFVGKLPDGVSDFSDYQLFHFWSSFSKTSQYEVSCLLECNNLHLSLDHILDPASDTVS